MHSSALMRVIVIAQDEAVRDSLVLLVKAAGCEAAPFGSGVAFLASPVAREADCLVLDEELNDLSAWEMLEFLQGSGSTLRIALFTGRSAPDLVRRAEQAGVAQLLQAPLMAADLMAFLARSRRSARRECDA